MLQPIMTRDTYDVTIRRASQLSQRLELYKSSQGTRRPSQIMKHSIIQGRDLQGSDRTLFGSSINSTSNSNSINTSIGDGSNSNLPISASCSYTTSHTDVRCADVDQDEDEDEDDDDDDEDNDDAIRRRRKMEETESDKGKWDRKFHYILLGFGVAFGLRNITDFPSLALKYGGGAFLFTYVILTYTVGLPLVYLEVSLGQYARGSVVKVWEVLPVAQGIAVSSLLYTVVCLCYSNTPAAWALYLLFQAVSGELSPSSSLPSRNVSSRSNNVSHGVQALASSSNLFYNSTLELSPSIGHFGYVMPRFVAAILIIWLIVFLCSSLGPRLLGKISFVFTVVPSVSLVIIFIAVCTLPGSVLGVRTFLNPKWQHLKHIKTWLDSLEFVLSTLGCGTGVLVTLSSYCGFHGNTFRNGLWMTTMSVVMTTLCGCFMLAVLGVQSRGSGIHIRSINQTAGTDLVFVVLPVVTEGLPTPAFWNGLFYLTVVCLGFTRMIVMLHCVHRGLLDLFTVTEVAKRRSLVVLAMLVAVLLSVNILTLAQNGMYICRLLKQSVPRLGPPIICVAECVVIGWAYGARRFTGRVSEMTGRKKSFLWRWLWRWGCPALLSICATVSVFTVDILHGLPASGLDRRWALATGWLLTSGLVLPGVAMAIAAIVGTTGTFVERLKELRNSPASWGPGHPEHEPQADLPDYVICHPDPFRPANALAMLTANLYLPNIVNFVNMKGSSPEADMSPGYLSDLTTLSSSDDESIDARPSHGGFLARFKSTITCLSHVIGMGNVVRFPYLALRHRGGAFILAYLLILLTCGLPLMVLETAIGQFSSLGPITVWRAVPFFKGVGFSMVGICLVTAVYYGVMTSWALYYLATTLTSVMPWQFCDNSWNTNSCQIITHHTSRCPPVSPNVTLANTTALPPCTSDVVGNCFHGNASTVPPCVESPTRFTLIAPELRNETLTSAEEYFYLAVAKVSKGFHEAGDFRWQLALCLLLAWTTITLCLIKGTKTPGKATYVLIIFPVSLLVIFLIRSSSLAGGHEGLRYLFTPDWTLMTRGHVWRDAATQVFFSLSLGSGTVVAVSTHNKFNNNIFRESAFVCAVDTCISLLSSLVIFAVVGAISNSTGLDMGMAAKPDLGLAFVIYSHASLQLPWPLVWAILFSLVLVILGVTTCSVCLSTALRSLMDVFSNNLKKQRVVLLLVLAFSSFLVGLPMVVQVGFYMVNLFDLYISGLPQLMVGVATLVAFSWVYGTDRLCKDISKMVSAQVFLIWRALWMVVSPVVIGVLLLGSLASVWTHQSDPSHPGWAKAIGFLFVLFLTAPILVGMAHEFATVRADTLLKRLKRACQPMKEWGATLQRCTSNVEYFPTVHTHLGIDLDRDALNTITDHVEFTTVGVRLPSLSQTTLLPLSPKTPRSKRPMDMRHKAILNHAYSNPQCNLSSGSLEKIGKRKKGLQSSSTTASTDSVNDVIVMKRSNASVDTCEAATQTEQASECRLFRQRSQPQVNVTKLVRPLTRAASWHHMGGEAAILEISSKQAGKTKQPKRLNKQDEMDGSTLELKKTHQRHNQQHQQKQQQQRQPQQRQQQQSMKQPQQPQQQQQAQKQQPQQLQHQYKKRRRYGQSTAPNLNALMASAQDRSDHANTPSADRAGFEKEPTPPPAAPTCARVQSCNFPDNTTVVVPDAVTSKAATKSSKKLAGNSRQSKWLDGEQRRGSKSKAKEARKQKRALDADAQCPIWKDRKDEVPSFLTTACSCDGQTNIAREPISEKDVSPGCLSGTSDSEVRVDCAAPNTCSTERKGRQLSNHLQHSKTHPTISESACRGDSSPAIWPKDSKSNSVAELSPTTIRQTDQWTRLPCKDGKPGELVRSSVTGGAIMEEEEDFEEVFTQSRI